MSQKRFFKLWGKFVNEQMEKENHYLKAELEWVQSHLQKRPMPTQDEKALLARVAHDLNPEILAKTFNFFTPSTLKVWFRQLVAKKWDYSSLRRKAGRPRISVELEQLILRLAGENPQAGYKDILGKLTNSGISSNKETVQNILRRNGINPSPKRKNQVLWKEFVHIHWKALVATDFFNWEVLTPHGLITYYVLFFINLRDRRVHLAGITTNPNMDWMKQMAKNLTMSEVGFLKKGQILIRDRDGKYCPVFDRILQEAGIQVQLLPPQSPNLNAYAERFVRTVKEQCLSHWIIASEQMLWKVLREFLKYYHHERNHQGIGNVIPFPGPEIKNINTEGRIIRKTRMGVWNYYYRKPLKSNGSNTKRAV